jgi:ribose transport system ATP-binding protein
VLEARGFAKTFSGRRVLRDVNLTLEAGEIHGLVGQNGSGKSTFIKILAGFHAPDPGAALRIDGRDIDLPLGPQDPAKLGLGFVHQDLGLSETATVLENLCVGRYQTGVAWRIRWRLERQRVREALSRFGIAVSPDAVVSTLREVDKARVAILRAAEQLRDRSHGVLVLDEPTAYLPADGIGQLFQTIREVAETGLAVLFVTHRLEEIFSITDRVSVLRDGRLIGTSKTDTLSEEQLISEILGFALDRLYPDRPQPTDRVALRVRQLRGSMVHGLSFELKQGEILGLTGLLGMGWEQVPYLLFGAEPAWQGSAEIIGNQVALPGLVPREAIKMGFALIPANRLRDGVVPLASVAENMTLPTIRSYFDRGTLHHKRETSAVARLMEHFQAIPREPRQAIGTLSGGNQQKVILAKWFARDPAVFLMHEPTHGVDIGARRQIFERVREAAQAGKAVLIASSEEEDLAALCHRVIVFRNGRPVSELTGADVHPENIKQHSFRRS